MRKNRRGCSLLYDAREFHDLAGRISTKEGKFCEIVLAGGCRKSIALLGLVGEHGTMMLLKHPGSSDGADYSDARLQIIPLKSSFRRINFSPPKTVIMERSLLNIRRDAEYACPQFFANVPININAERMPLRKRPVNSRIFNYG